MSHFNPLGTILYIFGPIVKQKMIFFSYFLSGAFNLPNMGPKGNKKSPLNRGQVWFAYTFQLKRDGKIAVPY
jgi:hypothetical protein